MASGIGITISKAWQGAGKAARVAKKAARQSGATTWPPFADSEGLIESEVQDGR